MNRILFALIALTSAFTLGCGNTSPTGGGKPTNSGTHGGDSRGTTYDRGTGAGTNAGDQKVDPSTTFQIKGPALTPSLKQGEKKNVNLTLDRGNNFKDSVKLSAEAPKGLKVEFAKPTVVAGDPADAVMSIEADKDAPAAEHVVRVTATPGMGKPTMLDVKVKVEQVK